MQDIAPELLENIEKSVSNLKTFNPVLGVLNKKLENGTATYIDAHNYAVQMGEILSKSYKLNITEDILPDGKMYYNIADRVITPTMTKNYEAITDFTKNMQEGVNRRAGINIKSIVPPLNNDRIYGIVNRVSSEQYEDIKWILDEPVKVFSQSIVDDFVHSNAEFHHKSGIKAKVIRKAESHCCKWCRSLQGVYEYPNVPKDVYRRHIACRCTVEYDPGDGKGKVQNVYTKKWKVKALHDKTNLLSSVQEMSDVRRDCLQVGIEYSKVKKLKTIDEKEIIKKISGEDFTKGSCSSLAFAYIGNKCGYDVIDYRGGSSRDYFCKLSNIKKIMKLTDVISYIEKDTNDFKAVHRLLENVEEGKEYYLATGKHAAIVRKNEKAFEYLELQSPESGAYKDTKNEYTMLDDNALKERFYCKKRHTMKFLGKYEVESFLIDADSLKNNDEFIKILGFINTEKGK